MVALRRPKPEDWGISINHPRSDTIEFWSYCFHENVYPLFRFYGIWLKSSKSMPGANAYESIKEKNTFYLTHHFIGR